MVDLAPPGSVPLTDFFARFALWTWRGRDAVNELELERRVATLPGERILFHRASQDHVVDALLAYAVQWFKLGKITAYVVRPGEDWPRSFSPRAWTEAFFPERMLLSDEIGAGHGKEFDEAIDRAPFVDSNSISDLFAQLDRDRRTSNPASRMRDCLLGLAMDGVLPNGEAETTFRDQPAPASEAVAGTYSRIVVLQHHLGPPLTKAHSSAAASGQRLPIWRRRPYRRAPTSLTT